MKLVRVALTIAGCIGLTAAACRPSSVVPCDPGNVCVNGTVRFLGIEGGFWTVRGDDSVTYDPIGGLPQEFQKEGLRVYLVAKERRDVMGIHQAGKIVEIVSLRRQD